MGINPGGGTPINTSTAETLFSDLIGTGTEIGDVFGGELGGIGQTEPDNASAIDALKARLDTLEAPITAAGDGWSGIRLGRIAQVSIIAATANIALPEEFRPQTAVRVPLALGKATPEGCVVIAGTGTATFYDHTFPVSVTCIYIAR